MQRVAVVLLLASTRAVAQPAQEIEPEPEPAPTPAPQPKKEPAAEPKDVHVHTMDELTIPDSRLRFGINFFGDTSAIASSEQPHSAFTVGTLGVRMIGTLSAEVDALGELAFETTDEGPIADIEQVLVRWRRSGGSLEVGRGHTNLGYWNTAYHHGLWLQTPIERPRALRFEDDGGIVPVHWVGATYTYHAGPLAVTGGVANGRGDIVDDIRVNNDTNSAKAVLAKARLKTDAFEIGAGAIYDRIAPAGALVRPTLANRAIDEYIGNAYLIVDMPLGVLAIVESFAFHHRANGRTWNTFAGYGLAGYHAAEWLTPYAAIDTMHGAAQDPFFTPDPMMPTYADFYEGIIGARFDTSTWSAIKVEARILHLTDVDVDDAYTAAVNWSFGL